MADIQQNPVAASGFSPQTNVVSSVSRSWLGFRYCYQEYINPENILPVDHRQQHGTIVLDDTDDGCRRAGGMDHGVYNGEWLGSDVGELWHGELLRSQRHDRRIHRPGRLAGMAVDSHQYHRFAVGYDFPD
jgi:hypothetical protein